jgi:hypothetical protein
MGEALTGMRLVNDRDVEPIPQAEYTRLREEFFGALKQSAAAGDEAARLLLHRFHQ